MVVLFHGDFVGFCVSHFLCGWLVVDLGVLCVFFVVNVIQLVWCPITYTAHGPDSRVRCILQLLLNSIWSVHTSESNLDPICFPEMVLEC